MLISRRDHAVEAISLCNFEWWAPLSPDIIFNFRGARWPALFPSPTSTLAACKFDCTGLVHEPKALLVCARGDGQELRRSGWVTFDLMPFTGTLNGLEEHMTIDMLFVALWRQETGLAAPSGITVQYVRLGGSRERALESVLSLLMHRVRLSQRYAKLPRTDC